MPLFARRAYERCPGFQTLGSRPHTSSPGRANEGLRQRWTVPHGAADLPSKARPRRAGFVRPTGREPHPALFQGLKTLATSVRPAGRRAGGPCIVPRALFNTATTNGMHPPSRSSSRSSSSARAIATPSNHPTRPSIRRCPLHPPPRSTPSARVTRFATRGSFARRRRWSCPSGGMRCWTFCSAWTG